MSDGNKIVLFLAELLTVVSALLVAFHPNILYASIALLFTFMGVAVMFVYAGADFLAGAQVIVYVGGVTILILFAIMLTQWLYQMKLRDVGTKLLVPLLIGARHLRRALARAYAGWPPSMLSHPAHGALAKFRGRSQDAGDRRRAAGQLPASVRSDHHSSAGRPGGRRWLARPK